MASKRAQVVERVVRAVGLHHPARSPTVGGQCKKNAAQQRGRAAGALNINPAVVRPLPVLKDLLSWRVGRAS